MYIRIRQLREDRDLTQSDLAVVLNCSQVCYSNYENGKRDIPSRVLVLLAMFYNTSIDYLLGITNEEKPYKRNKLSEVSN